MVGTGLAGGCRKYADAMAFTIRPATREDLPALVDIYNAGGVATTASWDLERDTLRAREAWFDARRAQDFPVLVLDDDSGVQGYATYGTFREKAGFRSTVEHTVYVRDGQRGSGGGELLMNALIDYARGRGVHVMVGALDAANAASRRFHQRLGFIEVGLLPEVGRKFERWLDLLLVQRVLD